MSQAPERERIWVTDGLAWDRRIHDNQTEYVLASRYEEAVRQRDVAVEALKRTVETCAANEGEVDIIEAIRKGASEALAACTTPPLARGDVKTGKVV